MAKAVKKRAYDSAVRREQAAQTRARILDAAAALFEANGYPSTTIREIADTAGVASDTVYAVFGSKPRILTALIDVRLTAGGGYKNVLDRPEAQAIRAEKDQRRQLQLFAHDMASILERVRPVYDMMRSAADVDPEMASIYQEMQSYRARNMRRVADWLTANGRLRMDAARAADILWALASPDTAKLLCDGRNWTVARYAQWLEDTLVRTLVR
jgi:AcrR family transcriptional regulator